MLNSGAPGQVPEKRAGTDVAKGSCSILDKRRVHVVGGVAVAIRLIQTCVMIAPFCSGRCAVPESISVAWSVDG